MAKYAELSPDGLAKTGAILGVIGWIAGLVWHGGMGQPSMMGTAYGMSYMAPMLFGGSLVGMAVGGFVGGWLVAMVYNWILKQ